MDNFPLSRCDQDFQRRGATNTIRSSAVTARSSAHTASSSPASLNTRQNSFTCSSDLVRPEFIRRAGEALGGVLGKGSCPVVPVRSAQSKAPAQRLGRRRPRQEVHNDLAAHSGRERLGTVPQAVPRRDAARPGGLGRQSDQPSRCPFPRWSHDPHTANRRLEVQPSSPRIPNPSRTA